MVSTTRPDLAEIVESDVLNAGMSEEDRRVLARALEFAGTVYGEKLLGTGEPAYGHALGRRATSPRSGSTPRRGSPGCSSPCPLIFPGPRKS